MAVTANTNIVFTYAGDPSINRKLGAPFALTASAYWCNVQNSFESTHTHTLIVVGYMSYSFVSQKAVQAQRRNTQTHTLAH